MLKCLLKDGPLHGELHMIENDVPPNVLTLKMNEQPPDQFDVRALVMPVPASPPWEGLVTYAFEEMLVNPGPPVSVSHCIYRFRP